MKIVIPLLFIAVMAAILTRSNISISAPAATNTLLDGNATSHFLLRFSNTNDWTGIVARIPTNDLPTVPHHLPAITNWPFTNLPPITNWANTNSPPMTNPPPLQPPNNR